MKLTFIKGYILKYLLMVIVAVSVISISIVSFARKEKVGMAFFKEVENTSDNYGEREDTRTLIARIDAQIGEVFKVLHSETSD